MHGMFSNPLYLHVPMYRGTCHVLVVIAASYNPIEMHNFDNAPPVEYDDDDEMVQLGGNEYEMDLSMHVPAPAEFDDGVEEEYGEY